MLLLVVVLGRRGGLALLLAACLAHATAEPVRLIVDTDRSVR